MKLLKTSNYNKKLKKKITNNINYNIANLLDNDYLNDLQDEYENFEIKKIEKEFSIVNYKVYFDEY